MPTTLADKAQHNGSGEADAATGNGRGRTVAGPLGSLLGDAVSAVGGQIAKRLAADLDDRDPDYIRDNLPLVWLLSSFYFRGEVRNLGNVPEDRAVELGVREAISCEEVDDVMAVLAVTNVRVPTNWSRRFKNHQEKLKSGDIYECAEVVRNLSLREQSGSLSTAEKSMQARARQILVSELAVSWNVTFEEAGARIDEVLIGVDAK